MPVRCQVFVSRLGDTWGSFAYRPALFSRRHPSPTGCVLSASTADMLFQNIRAWL
jgi:hypothetical protein